jgi:hypothetical protein
VDDVKAMSDHLSDKLKSKAKTDGNKSPKETSTKEESKKPPASSKAKNKVSACMETFRDNDFNSNTDRQEAKSRQQEG